MRILVAEDEEIFSDVLQDILKKEGYEVDAVISGAKAYQALSEKTYDALLTDWMMPEMDGVELIRKVRQTLPNSFPIIMLTVLGSEQAKEHALHSGADAFLPKPYKREDIVALLKNCIAQSRQSKPLKVEPLSRPALSQLPPHVAVCITGNLSSMVAFAQSWHSVSMESAYLASMQAPIYLLDTFVEKMGEKLPLDLSYAKDGAKIEEGHLHLCHDDKHLTVGEDYTIKLVDSEPVNFVRPSGDVLFESVSKMYGSYLVAGVLGGMGCDGARGSVYVAQAGGKVLIQDPSTASVAAMPLAALDMDVPHQVVSMYEMARVIKEEADQLTHRLHQEKNHAH